MKVIAAFSILNRRKQIFIFNFLVGLDPLVLKKNRALTEDFTKLYIELQREGLFNPCYTHIILRIVEAFVMLAIGYVLLYRENYFVKFIGMVILGFGHGRLGFLGHEAGHYSLTGNPKCDRYLEIIFYCKHEVLRSTSLYLITNYM